MTLETIIGQARVLVPLVGQPSLWASSGDLLALIVWMLVTLVAIVVAALTPRWPPAGDPPDQVPPTAAEIDHQPARAEARTWREVVSQRRYALARAAVIAVAVLTTGSIGLRIASANFIATTTNAGSDWSVAAGLGAADFQTILVNGTSGGSVSWNGGTATLKRVASVLSYTSLTNVRVSATGSMASSPTGYGVWTRASESSKKISGYVFQLDNSSQKRFELVWWSNGNEKATPWATAPFPTSFNASLPHALVVTTTGGILTARVDGSTVMTSTLPTASVKVGSITYAVPTGGRFGFITWSSTTASLSGIQAAAAP